MSTASVDVPVAPFPCTKVERVAFDDPNILDYLKRYPRFATFAVKFPTIVRLC